MGAPPPGNLPACSGEVGGRVADLSLCAPSPAPSAPEAWLSRGLHDQQRLDCHAIPLGSDAVPDDHARHTQFDIPIRCG